MANYMENVGNVWLHRLWLHRLGSGEHLEPRQRPADVLRVRGPLLGAQKLITIIVSWGGT